VQKNKDYPRPKAWSDPGSQTDPHQAHST